MESKYHLYIIKPNDILGSQKQEENKNFYIVLQVSQNGLNLIKNGKFAKASEKILKASDYLMQLAARSDADTAARYNYMSDVLYSLSNSLKEIKSVKQEN